MVKLAPSLKKTVFRTQVWNSVFSDEVKAAATTKDNFHPSPLKSLVDLTTHPRQVIKQDLCDTAVWTVIDKFLDVASIILQRCPVHILVKRNRYWKLHL